MLLRFAKKIWEWLGHFSLIKDLYEWVGFPSLFVLSVSGSIMTFLGAAIEGLSVTESIVLSVGIFVLFMLFVAIIIWIKQQFSTGKEKVGGSLAGMDFDEQTDFVHSVVERQVARASAKKPIQPKHDVWLRDVLCYIASGKWEHWQLSDQTDEAEINAFYQGINDIRQHALNGDLPIWGKVDFSGPFRLIKSSYWEDFGFDELSWNLSSVEEFKTEPDNKHIKDSPVYKRLKTSKAIVRKLWRADKRMSIIELRAEAVQREWLFGPDSLQGSEFALALSQAGLDEEIKFWGKQDRNDFETLNRQEPELEIPKNHWEQFKVEALRFETSNDNFNIKTVARRGSGKGYRDLRVNREQAFAWLTTTAERSKKVDIKKWQ